MRSPFSNLNIRPRVTGWLAGVAAGVGLASMAVGTAAPALQAIEAGQQGSPQGHSLALKVRYPADGTVFPPEIVPPAIRWTDESQADTWSVVVSFTAGGAAMAHETRTSAWTPEPEEWEAIKKRTIESDATITLAGFQRAKPDMIISHARITVRTSKDLVGAPIFYREVILPFIEAVKDPSRIRWRLGLISSPNPRTVLEKLPVCGNCHSFPKDASVLAMDVDYANSKGSYIISPVERRMALRPQQVITWDDYRREDGEQTYGLLSQISPDGQVVVSTVKDRSVFVPKPDLEFSQLFFPIKGILAIYDRRTRTFEALPGADDRTFVQSNPSWSPDGKEILFARARAYQLRAAPAKNRALLTPEECDEFLKGGKPFRFDVYRIAYNEGKGGTPQPLQGAADDGLSNYFPRYSPDGRWIVFCKARNYMLLQPDSQLFIVPAEGGVARRLRGNTSRMNSWHSWSPNSRWLVFSSKANGPFTQLFLTHIDEHGESTPPVELAQFTEPDRAANIPEFVPLAPDAIEKIEAEFLNDYSFARAGFVCEQSRDWDRAIEQYQQALRLNPANPHAHERLGSIFCNVKHDYAQGLPHCQEAVRLNPGNGQSHYVLGMVFFDRGDQPKAILHLTRALDGFADATDPSYTPQSVHGPLGAVFLAQGDAKNSAKHFREAVRLQPGVGELRYYLAMALVCDGLIEEPIEQYAKAYELKPDFDRLPEFNDLLSLNLAKAGRFAEAAASARKAVAYAKKLGREELARELESRIQSYESQR